MKKTFQTYDEAYACYSDILSGRDPDRKNPTISFVDGREHGRYYQVDWQAKESKKIL